MDGAGPLVRSLRSLGPQADLRAAAIGAVVLLRERLGFDRGRPKSPKDREPAPRLTEGVVRGLDDLFDAVAGAAEPLVRALHSCHLFRVVRFRPFPTGG